MRSTLALAVSLTLALPGLAADANKPHPHRGKLKPYSAEFKPVKITAADENKLAAGKPVFKKFEEKGEAAGRGFAIFVVDAPPDVVWKTIKSIEKWPRWIDNMKESEVYERKGEQVKARFIIGAMGLSVEYFIDHRFREANKYVTWTLDYDRESDLDESVGFWKLDPYNGDPNRTRVIYSVDIAVRGWVPGFIRTLLVDRGLKEATGWITRESEKAAKKK
jgi:ribosome-associated toxin RatA of RatAB toxin-antitoxin module